MKNQEKSGDCTAIFLREQQPKRLKKLSNKSYPGPDIFKHQGKLVYQYADLATLKQNTIEKSVW